MVAHWSDDFRKIFLDHYSLVTKVVQKITGHQQVDDIVQEVFLRLWLKRDQFKGDSQLKTWIYRVAVNVSLDHLRQIKRSVANEQQDGDELINDVSTWPPDHSLREVIEKGIQILAPGLREVFVLFFIEELAQDEIATVLQIPVGTVKSRVFNAKKQFTDFLQANGVSYGG